MLQGARRVMAGALVEHISVGVTQRGFSLRPLFQLGRLALRYYNSHEMIPGMTKAELIERLNAGPKFVLLDVRNPSEVQQGAIPSSRNVPLPLLLKLPAAQDWEHAFPDVELPGLNEEIVVYCQAGVRSEMAAQHLRSLGFKNVINYRGSWADWSAN
uniref:Rhodanese domain-containing protein n=1 Tax=Eutreptiella gymnastica TaxID=73025 RepID=A0A7S1J187_9EUGL|mmetsp:Transcript_5848/g.10527  ORF Transcript_5848/g.10527 Transcript_5848/m.10527 type:complete len:157 (+) Transcript_5848:38-508(+)